MRSNMLPYSLACFLFACASSTRARLSCAATSRFSGSTSAARFRSAIASSKSSVAQYACARRNSALTLKRSISRIFPQVATTSECRFRRSSAAALFSRQLFFIARASPTTAASLNVASCSTKPSARVYFLSARSLPPALKNALPLALIAPASATFSSSLISQLCFAFSNSTSSTSYSSGASPGTAAIGCAAPDAPKPYAGLRMLIAARSPFFIFITASSRPSTTASSSVVHTCSLPSGCSTKTVPSCRRPT
mmetsp:Transcript_21352/g.54779  ORF Transcript_21352/g.54779 Transcript_21352/m.54779 type:complete len:251 (+) Transcript_21352:240-992(+)